MIYIFITLLIVLNPLSYNIFIVPKFRLGIFNLMKKFSNNLYLCSSFDYIKCMFVIVLSHFQLFVGNSGSTLSITFFTPGIIWPALNICTFAPTPKPYDTMYFALCAVALFIFVSSKRIVSKYIVGTNIISLFTFHTIFFTVVSLYSNVSTSLNAIEYFGFFPTTTLFTLFVVITIPSIVYCEFVVNTYNKLDNPYLLI